MFLSAKPQTIASLTAADESAMFVLYDRYYGHADRERFLADLHGKTHAVILRDPPGDIQGFSTLKLFDHDDIRVLYSGDTIIERSWWGRNDFAQAWLRLAGRFKAEAPGRPLYWLLIVKGQRTYRYLGLFAQSYYPHFDIETPSDVQALMNEIAGRQFGDLYEPSSGRVFFPQPRSFLKEALEPMSAKDLARPEVRYFAARNPGYAEGDELVCLCDLSAANLTRLSRAWFEDGATKGLASAGEGQGLGVL